MIAKFKGVNSEKSFEAHYGYTFKENNIYNIETKIINNVIFVKDQLGNAFCTYFNVEDFIKEWEINETNIKIN